MKRGIAILSASLERVPNEEAKRVTELLVITTRTEGRECARAETESEVGGSTGRREPDGLEPPARGTASQGGRAVNSVGCAMWLRGKTLRLAGEWLTTNGARDVAADAMSLRR